MRLQRGKNVIPQRGLLGGLDLRQVEDHGAAFAPQRPVVVDHVESGIDDRCGETGAVAVAHVPIVQMQAAGAEDAGGEVELLFPVRNGCAAEEALGPSIDFGGDRFGNAQEGLLAPEGDLEVALVVERHGIDLAERVLAVEHPSVGAREECEGDRADARRHRRARFGGGAGALDPLALQVMGNLAALEIAASGLLHSDAGSADDRARVEEPDSPLIAKSCDPPGAAGVHELAGARR